VDSAPPPSPAGTTSGVLDRPAGSWPADEAGDPDDADARDDGAAVPRPWPADPEHAAAAVATATASNAAVKPRPATVMGSPHPHRSKAPSISAVINDALAESYAQHKRDLALLRERAEHADEDRVDRMRVAAVADASICPILTPDADRWRRASAALPDPLHIIEIADPGDRA
jgi:hypothetical protein